MSNTSTLPVDNLPWGHQDKEYKKGMSLIKKTVNVDEYVFTYKDVPPSRIPSQDNICKLWTSIPYKRNKKIHSLTKEELSKFPGLKQHVLLETKTEEDKHYEDSIFQNDDIALNSYHRMSINSSITTKTGPGPKFHANGCNACINAIVTRFDEHGNIQIMAMKRPENAASDAGEYQMSAGCLFFGGDGHQIKVDDKEYTIKGSVKYNLAEGAENMDQDGKLKGEAKAHAKAAILEKLWTDGKTSKDIVEKFDFHLLFKGIVDDTSNTRHRWVETSYVIHHVTGKEDREVLEHLKDSKVDPKRANVGDAVWRSIEMNPKGKVYSQIVIGEKDDYKKIWVEHDETSRAYNPATEFEFWHGDHSFVAARIYEYVSLHYSFMQQAKCGFGVSEPIIVDDDSDKSSHVSKKRRRE